MLPKRWFGICVNLIKQVQQSFSSTFLPSYKLMLVVRQDLGMSKGKIAAQCAHAAVGAYKQAVGSNAVRLWELSGQQKVAVKCKDVSELLDLCEKAKAVDLPVTLVQDAGRTQVKRGEHTVLAVGPGPSDKIDMITGRLKLM